MSPRRYKFKMLKHLPSSSKEYVKKFSHGCVLSSSLGRGAATSVPRSVVIVAAAVRHPGAMKFLGLPSMTRAGPFRLCSIF